jgi:hypothetical protein
VQDDDGGGVPSLFLGPAVKRKRQGSGGRRRHYGVKRASLPPPPYLYCGTRVMGIVVVLHYPDRLGGKSPLAARSGAAVPITVPLGNDDEE